MLSYFKTHGDVENVVMRRYLDRASKERKFKGSVFATFKVVEEVRGDLAGFLDIWEIFLGFGGCFSD